MNRPVQTSVSNIKMIESTDSLQQYPVHACFTYLTMMIYIYVYVRLSSFVLDFPWGWLT